MTRDEYGKALGPLLDQAHQLTMELFELSKQLEASSGIRGTECQAMSSAAHLAHAVSDMIYQARYPSTSGLADDVATVGADSA
jgi:hypothetical protein